MNYLLERLQQNPSVQAFKAGKQGLSNLSSIEEACIISAAFIANPQNMVIVKSDLFSAQRLVSKLETLLGKEQCILFSVEENLRVEAIASSPEMTAQKVEALYQLLQGGFKVCVTHCGAVVRSLPAPQQFLDTSLFLKVNQESSMEELRRKLIQCGYQQVARVDQPLCFALRGGILDVYSLNYEYPVRIEFFDCEIESIRYFDISSQRTISLLEEVIIIPATDILFSDEQIEEITKKVEAKLEKVKASLSETNQLELSEKVEKDLEYIQNHIKENHLYMYYAYCEKTASIFDYCKDARIILSSVEEIQTHLLLLSEETVQYIQERAQEYKMLATFSVFQDFDSLLRGRNVMKIGQFESKETYISSHIHALSIPQQSLTQLVKQIIEESQGNTILLCLQEAEIKEVIRLLIDLNQPYQIVVDRLMDGINISMDTLEEGFECLVEKLLVYTSKELFQTKMKIGRYANKFKEAEVLSSYQDLQIKDYVVHNQHGVGQYLGIVTRVHEGVHKDFLQVVYKGNDTLFVPLEQFKLVRKFVSREGVVPKLHRLGGNEWSTTKARLKENVKDIAERLVKLYSQREEFIGYAYHEDNEMQQVFEEEFQYELTPDQSKAVIEIKKDMMQSKPMDRLLCGDVGFGKTEVAIRAAFKAVTENKQVAFLCPTTILSRQHYRTFMDRFKSYPISIALLNRFVSESAQKQIIQRVKEGKIDILIGTHRILSKDIRFADLGLLVIDEEQRFGVEHKEKIKEIKQNIDVLSLSATPIPRTLQMSLIGIRSLSQLDTPPNNRMPVQTYVIEKNKSVIKEVIQRELARKGQVFYLYNNIQEIYQVARNLQKEIPAAQIAVAHGKMDRDEIEDVMMRFTMNEYNVLLCTTIIETGIDIPNVNTILIENADMFGLSQLYQIKGRVGRSDRVAYAYLMVKSKKQLTEIAQKRLQAIREFTELGSGYKIAMRDLTIRGAGDMLGANQSGFIDTVGIDMYIEMLQEAIAETKGIVKVEEKEMIKPQISIDSYIPANFAPQDFEKINLYQRIDAIRTKTELKSLIEEIGDIYGKLPKSVMLLFEKKRLEILINEPRIESFKEISTGARCVFTKAFSKEVDGVKFFELLTTISKDITIRYAQEKITVNFPKSNDWLSMAIEVLERTKKV